MRLRSRSNSITVDLMATEKIEDTGNLTRRPWMPFHSNMFPHTDSPKVEPYPGGYAVLFLPGDQRGKKE